MATAGTAAVAAQAGAADDWTARRMPSPAASAAADAASDPVIDHRCVAAGAARRRPRRARPSPAPTYRPPPQDDPTQRRPDITRARTLLSWEPTIALPEGLERTVRYFAGRLHRSRHSRRSQPVVLAELPFAERRRAYREAGNWTDHDGL